jgi:hypothetical protein
MKRGFIISGLFIICVFWIFFSIYGIVQLYTLSERRILIEDQRIQIKELSNKVQELRNLNELIPVLEQILTPLQIAELHVLGEQLVQKKRSIQR